MPNFQLFGSPEQAKKLMAEDYQPIDLKGTPDDEIGHKKHLEMFDKMNNVLMLRRKVSKKLVSFLEAQLSYWIFWHIVKINIYNTWIVNSLVSP